MTLLFSKSDQVPRSGTIASLDDHCRDGSCVAYEQFGVPSALQSEPWISSSMLDYPNSSLLRSCS